MLSKNSLKFIKSLQIKKFRKEHGLFLVEGRKSVLELLPSAFETQMVVVTAEYYEEVRRAAGPATTIHIETESTIAQLGTFESNKTMLAVAAMRQFPPIKVEKNEFVLALDGIQDPGNLGTIIRTADWFGITKILCSETTAEFYNPKVISSTMGSFTRATVQYCTLPDEIARLKQEGIEIYGAVLGGEGLKNMAPGPGVIVIGSEANGISQPVEKLLGAKITIPGAGQAESLNAAVAAGIILYHFKGI